mmetsp:Transcript_16319/g.32668  ORF Transcript_16319/g.32668 Transcript_16319/m.32668 type:complete len:414 (-) Transcript_16319:66-1307(-)
MVRQTSVLVVVGILLGLLHTHEAFQHGAFFAPGAANLRSSTCRFSRCGPLSLVAKTDPATSSSLMKLTAPSPKSGLILKMSGAAASPDETPGAIEETKKEGKAKTNLLVLGLYFLAWYALNVGYNIANKQVLNVFPCYATVAAAQLVVAWVWLLPQWLVGIRPVPKPSPDNMQALQKISLLHGFGHLVTVLSMGLGAVSFVHVVKAAEPVFAAVLSAIFAGSVMAMPVYLSLIPVCAGVAIASAGELSFTWACFGAAMMSNLLFASRAVFSKMAMSGKDQGENMDAANTFAVITMLATIICVPAAAILEGSKIVPAWQAAIAAPGMTEMKLATTLAMSGWYLYTYNEFAFKVLGMVSPVAQAVGNTVKRVVILIATSIAFATPMTPIGIAGSAIAMAGVLVYSLVEQAYKGKK